MAKFEVKASRIARGMTQEEVAVLLGITKKKYSNKERGAVNFSFDEKMKLTRMFGFDYKTMNETFFGGKLPDGDFKVPIDNSLYIRKPV